MIPVPLELMHLFTGRPDIAVLHLQADFPGDFKASTVSDRTWLSYSTSFQWAILLADDQFLQIDTAYRLKAPQEHLRAVLPWCESLSTSQIDLDGLG